MANNKIKGFCRHHLNDKLFQEIVSGINQSAILKCWTPVEWNSVLGGFITNVVTEMGTNKDRLVGLFRYDVEYTIQETCHTKQIVLKSKATALEMIEAFCSLIPDSKREFAEKFKQYALQLELGSLEKRELECMRLKDTHLSSIMPEIYWTRVDEEQYIFVFAMEFLDSQKFTHTDTIYHLNLWQETDILDVLRGLSIFHAKFYGKTSMMPSSLNKFIDTTYKKCLADLLPLWEVCLEENCKESSDIWTTEAKEIAVKIMQNLQQICDVLDSVPKTLVHNDVTLMNLCLRVDDDDVPKKERLCLYDWENCSVGIPQHDVASFLLFLIPQNNTDLSVWHHYAKKYLGFFKENLGIQGIDIPKELQEDEFLKCFELCMCIQFISRNNWACAIFNPKFRPPFAARLLHNFMQFIDQVQNKFNFLM